MNLPQLTSLQFLVIGALLSSELPGRALREELSIHGAKKSAPAFYQLMSRLEDAGLVEGWYEQKTVEGQAIKERWYKYTASGLRAYEATREFYADRPSPGLLGGLA